MHIGFLSGERNYANIKGDTGPVVYPAGFLYVFSILFWLTGGGVNVLTGIYVYMRVYIHVFMHICMYAYVYYIFVYQAGFLYVFSILYWLTGGGVNVLTGIYICVYIYICIYVYMYVCICILYIGISGWIFIYFFYFILFDWWRSKCIDRYIYI
jgi:hypothetical protein